MKKSFRHSWFSQLFLPYYYNNIYWEPKLQISSRRENETISPQDKYKVWVIRSDLKNFKICARRKIVINLKFWLSIEQPHISTFLPIIFHFVDRIRSQTTLYYISVCEYISYTEFVLLLIKSMSAPKTEPNTWKMCNKEEPLLSVGFVLKTSL